MIGYQDILAARERIKNYVFETPLEFSIHLSDAKHEVYLKLENQQRLKSFKVRGALSKLTLLSEEEKARGILAVSSGNHGAGVSYTSHILGGMKAKIYVPKTTPGSKLEKIKYYGAEVLLAGDSYDGAHAAALKAQQEGNLVFVDPCSDPDVIAGQGTVGLEIAEQIKDVDIILAPIGGGGLITGLSIAAKHLKPGVKIIGVQTSACPAMVHSLRDNKCYTEYTTKPSACDALVGGVGEIPYQMARQCIDEIVVVDEDEIRRAVAFTIEKEKIICEPSSAVGIAALSRYPELFKEKRTVVVVTGGNLDTNLMKELLS